MQVLKLVPYNYYSATFTLTILLLFKFDTQFENVMTLLMITTTYPLDDMKGEEDEPCLLGGSPTTQLAAKLFRHTVLHTPGEINVIKTIESLVLQKIGDQTVSVI